jgi:hypothetical protein
VTRFANGHPLGSKEELAAWMKYPTADAMDADHDRLHELLCNLLAVESHSMRKARGEALTQDEEDLAACEEAAVLHVQRWLQWIASA